LWFIAQRRESTLPANGIGRAKRRAMRCERAAITEPDELRRRGQHRQSGWFGVLVGLGLVAGCAEAPSADLDEPQDAEPSDGKADVSGDSCASVRCGNPEARNILFPGNPACSGHGCERSLADDALYVPPRNGRPWGDTYELGTMSPDTLSGYSSGRIALLRRLALIGDGAHAVMLDPSWPDGPRDFAGRGPERGEDIVREWLLDDPERTFLLVYSRRSTGWSGYAALLQSEVGDRVKVCFVDVPHLLVPAVPYLHDALVEPDAWYNGTCEWGVSSDPYPWP
jgi:hypothetical protein